MFSELVISLAVAYAPSINQIIRTLCLAISLALLKTLRHYQAHPQMSFVMAYPISNSGCVTCMMRSCSTARTRFSFFRSFINRLPIVPFSFERVSLMA